MKHVDFTYRFAGLLKNKKHQLIFLCAAGAAVSVTVGHYMLLVHSRLNDLEMQAIHSQQVSEVIAHGQAAKDTQITELKDQLRNQTQVSKQHAKELEELQEVVEELQAQNFTRSSPPVATSSPSVTTTIYDRIAVSESFRPQVVRALNLIQSQAPAIYSILNTHVTEIRYLEGFCGGWQMERPIYIGDCGGNYVDSIVASVIIHEAYHVYNVYVLGVYSSGTAEQELPSLRQELLYADALGVPAWYKEATQEDIAAWESASS